MATEPKSQRIFKRIGTHSGVFHCDEALACFMLKQLPEYTDAEVIRTRDQKLLDTCDIVVDVGGVYDPKTLRFDHHQRSFQHTLSTVLPDIAKYKHIRLSSAGLVYAHYGLEVITEVLKKHDFIGDTKCMIKLFLSVYDGFVEELDAIDNGIPMYEKGQPCYRINTHLSARVHKLNPEWNSKDQESNDTLFVKAMEIVGSEFVDKVVEAATVWWPARQIVENAILSRCKVHPSGSIIKLTERCPWKEHLLSLEEEMGIAGDIKFCIFHDASDSWRVQGIPHQPDSFVCRIFLHKNWMGVRDAELEEISGVKGSIFCHSTGFIAGNKTMNGALEMAVKSLEAATADKL